MNKKKEQIQEKHEYFVNFLRSSDIDKGFFLYNYYNLFVQDQKDSLAVMKQNGPGGYQKEMSKRWKELDESKREEYKLKYQKMKEEHEYKMKNDPEYFAAIV